jgi:ABC-type nickel/cobalt efflux system permease component RcnA
MPGHGKTIVAAYLVGSRGAMKHAAFLGAMVAFTHTISVFVLGIATLFLFQWVVPEKIAQVCGILSGISIVALGGWMMYGRVRAARHERRHAHHHHHHHHGHHHSHPHTHSHVPDSLSWAGLVALGVSGGLAPCESALVLMLSAIALGRAALGLLLLVSFSLGLAIVLVAIGALVVYAKNLFPKSSGAGAGTAFRWLSAASAAVVIVIGLLMTGVSAGILQSRWIAY